MQFHYRKKVQKSPLGSLRAQSGFLISICSGPGTEIWGTPTEQEITADECMPMRTD